MSEEEMSTMELLEKREHEVYEELGKRNYGDPERGKLLSEAKMYSEIRNATDQTEQTRLNNNAKNDLEERKLDIESEKVKNEQRRTRADLVKAGIFLLGGVSSTFLSYTMEEWFQKFQPLQRFGDKLHDLITRK